MVSASRALVVFACLLVASSAHAANYLVTNTNDSGASSLRAAITAANAIAGPHRITFSIAASGVQTIHLLTPLPAIHNQTVIDGTTQTKYDGIPIIEIDGSGLPAFSDGIHFDSNADGSKLTGVAVNRFPSHAIWIDYADACTVSACHVGTNAAGDAASPNGGNGVLVTGNNHLIGGPQFADRNVISGNAAAGIRVQGPNTSSVQVGNNYIGTNVAGSAAIPNLGVGLDVFDVAKMVVGGTSEGLRNVISGNGSHGVRIRHTVQPSFADGAIIESNTIGLNAAGTAKIANGADGLYLATSSALVGDIGLGNVISGNSGRGVYVEGPAAGSNEFYGNRIGVTPFNGAAGNGADGFFFDDSEHNGIGGELHGGLANVIAANGGAGVKITGFDAINNVIQGNAIGCLLNGAGSSLGNTGPGITTASDYTVIGGPSDLGNLIAYNGQKGIVIGGLQCTMLGNSIFSNTGLGIDLLDASGGPVTPNDTLDTDDGPNYFQNYPQILSLSYNTGTDQLRIQGRYSSEAGSSFGIEFYSSRQCDPSGYGEGETYIGQTDVNTNSQGVALFDVFIPNPPLAGMVITALATDFIGDTSEFSPCATLTPAPTDADGPNALAFAIEAPVPSPARGRTAIPFTLPRPAHVTLQVFDIAGRAVATVVDDGLPAGRHVARWGAEGSASGVYFARLRARAMDGSDKSYEANRTIVLVK